MCATVRAGRCARAHSGLEAGLPCVEVQRGELREVRVGDEHIERLALVDVCAAVCGHVDQRALPDLPHLRRAKAGHRFGQHIEWYCTLAAKWSTDSEAQ